MWKTCGIRICMTDVKAIRALLINEVVPDDPRQVFHGSDTGAYAGSLISLFQKAGIGFRSMKDIDESGITVINAVNTPKQGRKITSLQMEESMPAFRKTLSERKDLEVIVLNGVVAKKMFNRIAKSETGRNLIPSIATYKLRNNVYMYRGIRVLPSYIVTGENIQIEKKKRAMVIEDLKTMIHLLEGNNGNQ